MANNNPQIGCSCGEDIRILDFICEGRRNNEACASQLHIECFIRAKQREPERQISCVNCAWVIVVPDLIDKLSGEIDALEFLYEHLTNAANIARNNATDVCNINDVRNTTLYEAEIEANETYDVLIEYYDIRQGLRDLLCEFFIIFPTSNLC